MEMLQQQSAINQQALKVAKRVGEKKKSQTNEELRQEIMMPRPKKSKKSDLLLDVDHIDRDYALKRKLEGHDGLQQKYTTSSLNESQEIKSSLVDESPRNADLSQIRLFLGSEQLLREQSARTHSVASEADGEPTLPEIATESLATSSIFDRPTFKEFTAKKMKQIVKKENIQNLLKMREQTLEIRHQTQVEYMKHMLASQKVSPRTFQVKSRELEKWVTREREDLHQIKKDFQKSLFQFADTLQRTQRDLAFMTKIVNKRDFKVDNAENPMKYENAHLFKRSFSEDEFGQQSRSQNFKKFSNLGLIPHEPDSDSKMNRLASGAYSRGLTGQHESMPSTIKIIDEYQLRDHLPSSLSSKKKEPGSEDRDSGSDVPWHTAVSKPTSGQKKIDSATGEKGKATDDGKSIKKTGLSAEPAKKLAEVSAFDSGRKEQGIASGPSKAAETLTRERSAEKESNEGDLRVEHEVDESMDAGEHVLKVREHVCKTEEAAPEEFSDSEYMRQHAITDNDGALDLSTEYKNQLVDVICDQIMELIIQDFAYDFDRMMIDAPIDEDLVGPDGYPRHDDILLEKPHKSPKNIEGSRRAESDEPKEPLAAKKVESQSNAQYLASV
jgi:hypothetical protein